LIAVEHNHKNEFDNSTLAWHGKGAKSKIENGKCNLPLAKINKIAAALGVRVNFDLPII
jgi:transcriptional regulator with XRE-family HTH domain